MTSISCSASTPRLMRIGQVSAVTGLSRSTIYARLKAGRFPRPVKIGNLTCWVGHEIDDFIADAISASRTPMAAA